MAQDLSYSMDYITLWHIAHDKLVFDMHCYWTESPDSLPSYWLKAVQSVAAVIINWLIITKH